MKFLITGGAGSVGKDLTLSLLEKGHHVRVLDKNTDSLKSLRHENLEQINGMVEDQPLVKEAIKDVDVVLHLAWSFSDNPKELLEGDLKGHIVLLDEALAAKVSHFFYTSTAVVYGKLVASPITEESPCLVEDARKPFYGIAKLTAEKLTLACWKMRGLPVTIFRWWWSYGKDIAGRHLREMIKLALTGQPLQAPEDAGGSFLHHDDLTNAVILATQKQKTFGEIFNLATIYLSWEDVARIIIEITNSSSPVEVIPAKDWKGAKFLTDRWELSSDKAKQLFNYHSLHSSAMARQTLKEAITQCYKNML